MHTKNINRGLQTSSTPVSGLRLSSQTHSQAFDAEFSSDTYASLRRKVAPLVPSDTMNDLQRGSFQRKFRSLWFNTSGKKKEDKDPLKETALLKSLSSPSLSAPLLEKTSNTVTSAASSTAFAMDPLQTDVCPDDCQCNQVCPCCIQDQQQELAFIQRNLMSAAHEKDFPKACLSQTLPKNFTAQIPSSKRDPLPPQTSVDDQYVFVVSDLETPHQRLTVRTEPPQISPSSSSDAEFLQRGNERKSAGDGDPNRSLASAIPDRMGSAESQDYVYKSSSASESGRGTLPSETERLLQLQEVFKKEEPQYSTVSKKNAHLDSAKKASNHRSKYPQLYVASTRAPMPAVIESESWVSDGSTFREVVRPSIESQPQASVNKKKSDRSGAPAKLASKNKAGKVGPKNGCKSQTCQMDRWKSMESISSSAIDRDDMTSEFTADVSTCNQRDTGLTQDLRTLQVMYDKIFKRLSVGNHSVAKYKRRTMGSISTINSIGRAGDGRRMTSARKQPLSDSPKRIRKVEEHVNALAKSVGNLTVQLKEQDKLHDQIASLRKEFASMQQQMNHLQSRMDSQSLKSKPSESYEKLYSSVKKQSKLSRIFSDDPTPLRLFLKKLGYERYSCLFDEERIGMEELLLMTEEKLGKLGIPLGPRTRIFQEIHRARTLTRNRHH